MTTRICYILLTYSEEFDADMYMLHGFWRKPQAVSACMTQSVARAVQLTPQDRLDAWGNSHLQHQLQHPIYL